MNYEVGQYVDLTHLNGRRVLRAQKKSITEKFFTAIQVDEGRYIFTSKTPRHIPVVYA